MITEETTIAELELELRRHGVTAAYCSLDRPLVYVTIEIDHRWATGEGATVARAFDQALTMGQAEQVALCGTASPESKP